MRSTEATWGLGRAGRTRRGGQVLLVAVLLMMAILLVGTLFVAIVSYNQYQTSRHGDVVAAGALAEAGIRYADYMLTHSPLGADWRPPLPPGEETTGGTYDAGFWGPDGAQDTDDDYYLPEEMARGYFTQYSTAAGVTTIQRLGYTRYPGPSASGADLPTLGQGHVLLRVTYNPGPPFEPANGTAPTPDKLSQYIKIEAVGVVQGRTAIQRKLVACKAIGLTDYLVWVTDREGTRTPASLGAYPLMDLDNSGTATTYTTGDVHQRGEFLVSDFDGPLRVDTSLRLVGGNVGGSPYLSLPLPAALASNQVHLTVAPTAPGGYLRADDVQVRGGISDPVVGAVGPFTVWGQSTAVSWPGFAPAIVRQSSDPLYNTYSGRVLDGVESQDTAGDSRFVKPMSCPDAFTVDPATGADRYRGLTRDSGSLTAVGGGSQAYTGQFCQGPGLYVDNYDDVQFARTDGSHDLDGLMADWLGQIPRGDPRAAHSGWNALHTLYTPPGVEAELFPTEAAVLADAGVPALSIVTSATAPPTSPAYIWWPGHASGQPGIRLTRHDAHWQTASGDDSGLNVMYRDYPTWPNAVVFAEGNVRIRGTLPARTTGAVGRDYGLTVVSGATMYVDGQLMSPRDASPSLPDEDDTKIALLARDHVCLNTTMLAPQMTTGMVPAVPDDPSNPDPDRLHWALSAGGGILWTRFAFGVGVPMGSAVGVHIVETAADPGPSGLGITVRAAGGAPVPYDFDGNPAAPNSYTFSLMPPGAALPGPGANAVAPVWATSSWPLNYPAGSYLFPGPGAYNVLAIAQRDPPQALGATDLWVKRWKIQEWAAVAGAPRPLPVGTLHARVSAMIYAQGGCWFVIPGDYFDAAATPVDRDGDGVSDSVEYRRYNYDITVRGTIAENYTAPTSAVKDWNDKWAYPFWPTAGTVCWSSIHYVYDESLRAGRNQPYATVSGGVRVSGADPAYDATRASPLTWNLPRAPVLPVCRDLMFIGESS